MAISPGAAVGEGFALIRREPKAVLIWGLVIMAVLAVMMGGWGAAFSAIAFDAPQSSELSGPQAAAMLGRMFAGQGLFVLGILIAIALRPVISAAVWRAVLKPQERRFAYLRIGMAELYVFAIYFIVGFAANLAMMPFLMLLGGVGLLVYLHQWIAAVALGAVVLAACIAVMIYVMLRVSLVGPMVVDDDEFHLVDAWRITKGHVGRLFGVGFLVALLLLGAEVLVYAIVIGLATLGIGVSAGGFDHLDAFFQRGPRAVVAALWPYLVPAAVLGVPIAGAVCAISLAPWARMYRDLVPSPPP